MLKKIIFIGVSSFLLACAASRSVTPTPEPPRPIASQQFKNPPVFYPVRSVRSASPSLSEYPNNPSRKIILKKFYYDLSDSTLCEVGEALANSFKYGFFCAPSLTERKYSVNKILTPYELRDLIEKENDVRISIDTVNKEVRLLGATKIVPKFSK